MKESDVIAGKYRLVSLLGQGGMGSVWRAQHLALNAPVAIKLIDPTLAGSGEGLARFHREAQAAAALRSPHVVQVLDHGVDPDSGQPFIVMEMMEGESLASRIQKQGRLSPAETARVVSHVARALSRAHAAGIVHRDLKPDNVFLVQNEDEEVAKVLDFGIAKSEAHRLGHGPATQTGAVMGTPYYMSPEQISGSKGLDFRTDLWALGVIACECLTGRRPFDSETIGGLVLGICVEPPPRPSLLGPVPPSFDGWFARATARDMTQRFQSARELADSLRSVCNAELGTQPVPSRALPQSLPTLQLDTASPLSRSAVHDDGFAPPRPRSRLALFAVLGAGAIAAAGVALWLRTPSSQPTESAASSAAPPALVTAVSPAPPAPTAPPVEPPQPATPEVVPVAPSPAETAKLPEPAAPAVAADVARRPPRPPAQKPKKAEKSQPAETTKSAPPPAVKPDPPARTNSAPTDVLDERR